MVRNESSGERWAGRARGARKAWGALLSLGMILAWSEPAFAYVGPGAGITMLGALGAVILAVLFALGGLILWPIRALRRRRAQASSTPAKAADDSSQGN